MGSGVSIGCCSLQKNDSEATSDNLESKELGSVIVLPFIEKNISKTPIFPPVKSTKLSIRQSHTVSIVETIELFEKLTSCLVFAAITTNGLLCSSSQECEKSRNVSPCSEWYTGTLGEICI